MFTGDMETSHAAEWNCQVFQLIQGFGFITPDQGGKDVFVHITAVERSGIGPLDEGMRVSFETEPDKRGKGPKAVNLQMAQ